MELPFSILAIDVPHAARKWQQQFVANGRKRHEGIWRRTQEPSTAENSGYKLETDARWKLVHFYDEYDLLDDDNGTRLVISKPYLWWNTALPSDELEQFYAKTISAMQRGGWDVQNGQDRSIIATRGDLSAHLKFVPIAEAEKLAQRKLPSNYSVLDCEIYGPNMPLSAEERARPWSILSTGIRQPLRRGTPTVTTDVNILQQYTPFQLELGCGPSIEAGVPPLAHLHRTYAISDPRTHRFLIGADDDLPVRFFEDTEAFYRDASLLYATAMVAQPTTAFYLSVKNLFERGIILDPVFTNNYDGLVSDIGMTEWYMRRFEDSHVLPDVSFHPDARALVVVGSHADRRKLQERARTSGLKVIYVDPESYVDEATGTQYPYPIEAPQDEDILYRMSAEQFAHDVLEHL